VVLWLVAGAIILRVMDLNRAETQAKTLRDVQRQASQRGLDRQLAIGHYLESQPASALEVLDRAVAMLPEGTLLTSYRYGREGEITLGGLLGGERELTNFMEKLSTLGEVDYKSAKRDGGGFRFEVRLKLADWLPATQPATEDKTSQPGQPDEPQTGPGRRTRSGPEGMTPGQEPAMPAGPVPTTQPAMPGEGPTSRPASGMMPTGMGEPMMGGELIRGRPQIIIENAEDEPGMDAGDMEVDDSGMEIIDFDEEVK
jgi:hypothetical protein